MTDSIQKGIEISWSITHPDSDEQFRNDLDYNDKDIIWYGGCYPYKAFDKNNSTSVWSNMSYYYKDYQNEYLNIDIIFDSPVLIVSAKTNYDTSSNRVSNKHFECSEDGVNYIKLTEDTSTSLNQEEKFINPKKCRYYRISLKSRNQSGNFTCKLYECIFYGK